MKQHLIEINHDVFNIAKRIKRINKSLKVFYNKLNSSFELYSFKFGKYSFEKNLGKTLNFLTEKYVYTNRIENLNYIIEKIDNENLKIENFGREEQSDSLKQMFKTLIDYANKKGADIDFSSKNIL